MEIRAYNELYLEDAMSTMGTLVDYAINYCFMEIDFFISEFIQSGVARKFENGDPATVAGKSAVELYWNITAEDHKHLPDYVEFDRSPEYWVGWALAYCQWYMNRTFREIVSTVKPSEMLRWYPIYHEMDILHVVDAIEDRIKKTPSNLERLRKQAGYSQAQLADLSTVSLRSIQMYEQRVNDISKAQFNTLNALARVLRCTVYDIVYGSSKMKFQIIPLSKVEENAVAAWTGHVGEPINQKLRGGKKLDKEEQEKVTLVQQAISKSITTEEIVMYRVWGRGRGKMPYKKGQSVIDLGFMEASLLADIQETFPNRRIKMIITVPKGTTCLPVEPYNHREYEQGVLFPIGTNLLITNTKKAILKDFFTVYCTVVQ